MAYITSTRVLPSLRERLDPILASLWSALEAYGALRARRAQIEALQALSDQELAARGLTRDQIVHHVFRDRFGY